MLFSGMTYPIYLGFGKQQLGVRNVIETSIPLAKVMGRTLSLPRIGFVETDRLDIMKSKPPLKDIPDQRQLSCILNPSFVRSAPVHVHDFVDGSNSIRAVRTRLEAKALLMPRMTRITFESWVFYMSPLAWYEP